MRLPLLWRVSVPGALVRGAVWAFLAAALVWTVGCKFYGVVANKDECYMALCCRGWGEQPVAMLSFFTGWIAMRVFGDQVITLRLLAMACYLVAILMPVWYFYHRTGNRLWSVYLLPLSLWWCNAHISTFTAGMRELTRMRAPCSRFQCAISTPPRGARRC